MIATLVLASVICTSTINNPSQCEVNYLHKWAETSTQYTSNDDKCLSLINNELKADSDAGTFQNCYRVIKKPGLPTDSSFLVSVSDPDDSFIEKDVNLKVE